jgi:hypothetical protein
MVLASLFPDLCQMRTHYSFAETLHEYPLGNANNMYQYTRKCHPVQSISAGSNVPGWNILGHVPKKGCIGAIASATPLTAARKRTSRAFRVGPTSDVRILFNDLVGLPNQDRRQGDSESPRCLEVHS